MTYNIGILGAGSVGSTLGIKWALKGHKVTFGVRNPEKYLQLSKKSANISVEPLNEMIKTHSLLVLALPGREVGAILSTLGDLTNKQIIDATNMYGMNKLEEQFPKSHFVKAFNHIGFDVMQKPQIGNDTVTLLYCGNQEELLKITNKLIKDIGFEPFFIGDSTFASDLESYAMLWIKMSRKIGRNFGFKLIH